jgi:hypothetical protein
MQPGGLPVTTTDLAALPGLDRKAVDAFVALATAVPEPDLPEEDVEASIRRKVGYLFPDTRKARVALHGRGDDELEEVARIYRENIDGAPIEVLQSLLGLSERTAKRRVSEARERGFLPPTTRGRKKA